MKHSIYLVAFFLFTCSLWGQSFQIIKVAGIITDCEAGDTLRLEDKIKAADTLCFTNTKEKYAVAAIIDLESKDRYLLKATESEAGVQKTLVKDGLIRSRAMTGTRSGKLNTLLDLQTFFGDADFLVLGGKLRLELNPESLAMNADSFFYASYEYQGETINKKLPFEGPELIFSAEELYQVDDQPIEAGETAGFTLYYYQPKLKQRREVARFNPYFPPDEAITKELDIIYATMADAGRETLLKELTAYLVEVYGKTDADNLNDWLEAYLQGKE